MKKRLLCMTMAMLFVFALAPVVRVYANDIGVTIEGQRVVFPDSQPQIVDGRTLVPVRAVFETLGFVVGWDDNTRTATLTRGTDTVVITVGSAVFTTNGVTHILDVPASIIGGSTMLPIRAVLESVGYFVGWNNAVRVVTVSATPPQAGAVPRSMLTIPNRELTHTEFANWRAEYHELGGANSFEVELVRLINQHRADEGVAPLIINDTLMMASRFNAHSMADLGYTEGGHPVYGEFNYLITSLFMYNFEQMGWNTAYGQPTPEILVQYWMGLSGHRNNMLHPAAVHVGVGFHDSYWTFAITDGMGVDNLERIAFTIPNRRLTDTEVAAWTAEYRTLGGANAFELEVVRLLNEHRAAAGVPPLAAYDTLMMAARFESHSMCDLHYSNVDNPVYGGIYNIAYQVFGYSVGFNFETSIAWGQRTPEAVVQVWMGSPSHRNALLDPNHIRIGVGYHNFFWTFKLSYGDNVGGAGIDTPTDGNIGAVTTPAGDTPHITFIIPNRRLTDAEIAAWTAEYHALGGIGGFELEVVRLMNQHRVAAGLTPLEVDPILMMAARFKSQSMANLDYFSHTSPVYGHFANISREVFGFPSGARSENIADGQWSPDMVVNGFGGMFGGWMQSPGHRDNIMNPSWTRVGIGFHDLFWTAKFY